MRLIERRDYVASPKPSGYRSLHLIVEVPIFLEREKRCVKVEVQLRTISMNFWASLEHQLRYKKDLAERMPPPWPRSWPIWPTPPLSWIAACRPCATTWTTGKNRVVGDRA